MHIQQGKNTCFLSLPFIFEPYSSSFYAIDSNKKNVKPCEKDAGSIVESYRNFQVTKQYSR